jgi:hypothetical protein
MWQAAKWWTPFYKDTADTNATAEAAAVAMMPQGFFATRQKEAAIVG